MRYPSQNTVFKTLVSIVLLTAISYHLFKDRNNSTSPLLESLGSSSSRRALRGLSIMNIPIYQHQSSRLAELNPFGAKNVWEITTTPADPGRINNKNEEINKNLSILTQNVWFDTATCSKERYEAFVQQIKLINADVVCLQEVIGNIMTVLTSNKFIQKTYYMSDSQKLSTFDAWYGVVLLVRKSLLVKFTKLQFPYSRMGRSLICAHLNWKGESGIVASAHFESADEDIEIRKRQWTDSTNYFLKEKPSFAFMCGDFNIYDDPVETEFLEKELKWNDSWLQKDALKEDKDLKRKGITFGTFQPGWALPLKRLDRILYQSRSQIRVSALSVRTIGDEPLTSCAFASPLVIYQSDHLGLVAQFNVTSESN